MLWTQIFACMPTRISQELPPLADAYDIGPRVVDGESDAEARERKLKCALADTTKEMDDGTQYQPLYHREAYPTRLQIRPLWLRGNSHSTAICCCCFQRTRRCVRHQALACDKMADAWCFACFDQLA